MMHGGKLKPNWGLIVFYGIVFVLLIGNIILHYDNERPFTQFFAILFMASAVMCLNGWLKTKNWWDFNFMLLCICSGLVLGRFIKNDILIVIFTIVIAFLFIMHFYGLFMKRNERRYRKILEMAAAHIHESEDGFTPRPYPAGEAKYTEWEITGLAKFLKKYLIALTKFENERVLLIVNDPRILWFQRVDLVKSTYVAFDFKGNISVNIAERDYKKYRDELTFDQLCEALGNLFKTFLTYFQNDEKDKIIALVEKKMS